MLKVPHYEVGRPLTARAILAQCPPPAVRPVLDISPAYWASSNGLFMTCAIFIILLLLTYSIYHTFAFTDAQ